MTYSAASRKDIRTAEKAQVIISVIDREVISGLMSVANGRHWINERLAEAGVFRDPFSPDALIHAYQSGLRAQGIGLLNNVILYAPDQFIQMIREAHERSAADAARISANHSSDSAGDTDYPTDEFGRYIDPADSQGAQPTQ